MENIEIGIDIVAKLYLHVTGNDLPTPFEVKKITAVEEKDLGTVITYVEPPNRFSSSVSSMEYIVDESVEDINKAIEDSKRYRDAAIDTINSMLEN